MLLKEETARIQSQLGQICLTGNFREIKGIHSRERVELYGSLISNIFSRTLHNAFPIARRLLRDQWNILVKEFIASGKSSSPSLWMMPQDFVFWVEENHKANELEVPYLDDLLLFEWTEVYIYMKEDEKIPDYGPIQSARLDIPLVINPDATLLQLRYPVFHPIPENKQLPEGNFFLLVFRHPTKLDVQFIELQPLFVLALNHLLSGDNASSIAQKINEQVANSSLEQISDHLEKFITMLIEKGMVLGQHQNDQSSVSTKR